MTRAEEAALREGLRDAIAMLARLEAALAMAQHELDKREPHEFAGPADARGCCAVCHEPVDFLPHQPATLRAELDRVTGLWYGACAARTELRVEIERLRTTEGGGE